MHLQYGNEFYEMPYSGCENVDPNVETFSNLTRKSGKDSKPPQSPLFWGMLVSCFGILLYQLKSIKLTN